MGQNGTTWTIGRFVSLVLFAGFVSFPSFVFADCGPKAYSEQWLQVKFADSNASPQTFRVVLLGPNDGTGRVHHGREIIPGLGEACPDGWQEIFEGHRAGPNRNEFCFRNFYRGVPGRIRAAIYFPEQDRIVISEPVETHPFMNHFLLEVDENEKVELRRTDRGAWLANCLLTLWERGFLLAFAMTLLIELAVLLTYVRLTQKEELLKRLLVTGSAVNILSHPVLWCVSVIAFWFTGFWVGLVAFIFFECLVFGFEGLGYRLFGKLDWKQAFSLSLMANALTVLAGLIIHSF